MTGRPPKPNAEKLLTGNPGERPLETDAPCIRPGRPECPEHMQPLAKELWLHICDQLDNSAVLTLADRVAMELLCQKYAEWRLLSDDVIKNGHTEKVFMRGAPRMIIRPEAEYANKAWSAFTKMLREFALTPWSRSVMRVKPVEDKQDDFESFLKIKHG